MCRAAQTPRDCTRTHGVCQPNSAMTRTAIHFTLDPSCPYPACKALNRRERGGRRKFSFLICSAVNPKQLGVHLHVGRTVDVRAQDTRRRNSHYTGCSALADWL